MPIWLRNLQSSVRFSEHLLRLQCNLLLSLVHASRYDVSVVCMESDGIRNLNRVYRKVDGPTDVLSFPYHEVTTNFCTPILVRCRSSRGEPERSELTELKYSYAKSTLCLEYGRWSLA